jgi:predicted transcriptional regulator
MLPRSIFCVYTSSNETLQKGFMTIPVEPNLDHPIPETLKAHSAETLSDHVRVVGNTALMLNELGDDETFDMTDDDVAQAANMMQKIKVDGGDQTKDSKAKDLKTRSDAKKPGVALALGHFVTYYDHQVIQDKVQLRNIAVNTLLEILDQTDDEKNKLKAAELLGKAGDLFTDKAEITITHKSSDELKDALRQRIQLLMQMHENRPKTMAEKAMGEIEVVDVKAKEVNNDDQTRDK